MLWSGVASVAQVEVQQRYEPKQKNEVSSRPGYTESAGFYISGFFFSSLMTRTYSKMTMSGFMGLKQRKRSMSTYFSGLKLWSPPLTVVTPHFLWSSQDCWHLNTNKRGNKIHHLRQCFPTLVLKYPCPACFRCFSAPTHLIQMISLLSGFCRGLITSWSFESGVLEQQSNQCGQDMGSRTWGGGGGGIICI